MDNLVLGESKDNSSFTSLMSKINKDTDRFRGSSMSVLSTENLELRNENKILREALIIAYGHCEDNLMDETIDVIRMALEGEEVKDIWANELAKGYELLKEQ